MLTEEFKAVTSEAAVETYKVSRPTFQTLLTEVKELSRKKPDATMNAAKVRVINRVLADALNILEREPEGRYLDKLDEAELPSLSDAVLAMVQFETAYQAFRNRYYRWFEGDNQWITQEFVGEIDAEQDGEDAS